MTAVNGGKMLSTIVLFDPVQTTRAKQAIKEVTLTSSNFKKFSDAHLNSVVLTAGTISFGSLQRFLTVYFLFLVLTRFMVTTNSPHICLTGLQKSLTPIYFTLLGEYTPKHIIVLQVVTNYALT